MSLPRVTCVMTAYNYARYVAGALESVLSQDYPGRLLDVVVVDDGSTDDTADMVARVQAGAGGRVTLIRQANAGLAAATQAALRQASGDLVAICDADDEWLPGKIQMQVEVLSRRPEVSVVYGDMQVIDEAGSVLDRSFFRRQNVSPQRGRRLDELAAVNFTTNSTLMLRARDLVEIPPDSPYADYWLVMHAAAVGELELIERPLANYRLHGSNMSFGAAGDRHVREVKRELKIRRQMLTGPVARSISPAVLVRAALDLHATAHTVSRTTGEPLADVVPISDAQRDRADRALHEALATSDPETRLRLRALALLLDPVRPDAARLVAELTGPPGPPDRAPAAPSPSRRLTVASARELIADPAPIAEYCARVAAQPETTLLIVADPHALDTTAKRLRASLIHLGIDPEDCPDMAIVPAPELQSRAGRSLLAGAARLTPCPELQLSDGA